MLAAAIGVIAGDGLERDHALDERRGQNREVAEVRTDVHEDVRRPEVLLQVSHDVRFPAPARQEMRHERHIRCRHAELMFVDRNDQIDVAVLREVLDRRHLLPEFRRGQHRPHELDSRESVVERMRPVLEPCRFRLPVEEQVVRRLDHFLGCRNHGCAPSETNARR